MSAGRDGADGRRKLRIGEVRGWSLVQVAAFARTLADLESAMRVALRADLPKRTGDVVNIHSRRVFKTGAEEYWILTRDDDDCSRSLQAAVAPGIGAVTPLSHSRTCIFIEGAVARKILASSIALDFDPDVFLLGQFALTGLHHTPVLIHRTGANCYELYVMRTFGVSAWDWLTAAALSSGYEVISAAPGRGVITR